MNMIQWRYKELSGYQLEEVLLEKLKTALTERYGPDPDDFIMTRMEQELYALGSSGLSMHLAALHDLTLWAKENDVPYRVAGTDASSFLLYLLNITKSCPLPPHSYCPKCRGVYWRFDVTDGFDLPDRHCPADGTRMRGDGHDIPWQTFWGYPPHEPGFTLAFPEHARQALLDALEQHWLKDFDEEAKSYYPDKDTCIFCFGHFCIIIEKEVQPTAVSLEECKTNWRELLHEDSEHDPPLPAPGSFADLVAMFGLVHGVGVWDEDAKFMHDRLGYELHELICFREDVLKYFLEHSIIDKDAWKLSERIRKGRAPEALPQELYDCRDKWVLSRIAKARYLCSKGVAVEHLMACIDL